MGLQRYTSQTTTQSVRKNYKALIMLIVLFQINIIFLASIMWVLITKLRATNTLESRQYRCVDLEERRVSGICMLRQFLKEG